MLSYQNLNPKSGHQSYLIKFSVGDIDKKYCILVDPGYNVDIEDTLGPDENLLAVLVTHMHLDHYYSLGDNLADGAPILTSEDNISIMETIFEDDSEISNTDEILQRVESVDGWYDFMEEVRICSFSVGHVPGAVGYLIQIEGEETMNVMVSGDYSFTSAAGNPRIPEPESMPKIDVLFLNAKYSDENGLTKSIKSSIENVVKGGRTLVAGMPTSGVQFAYTLGNIAELCDLDMDVRILGETAEIYESLEYDIPNVETYVDYTAGKVLDENSVNIASGDDVSQSNLFRTISGDPNSLMVQLNPYISEDEKGADCRIEKYSVTKHPSKDSIESYVTRMNPLHTVVQHGNTEEFSGGWNDTFTWSDDRKHERDLYRNEWISPPWLRDGNEKVVNAIMDRNEELKELRGVEYEVERREIKRGKVSDQEIYREGVNFPEVKEFIENLREPEERVEQKDVNKNELGEEDVSGGGNEAKTEGVTGKKALKGAVIEALEESGINEKLQEDVYVGARVIDAGDGECLLKVNHSLDLEHGEEVDLRIYREE